MLGLETAHRAHGGTIVTSGRFTDEARAFMRGKPVYLVDGDGLLELMRSVKAQPAPARGQR